MLITCSPFFPLIVVSRYMFHLFVIHHFLYHTSDFFFIIIDLLKEVETYFVITLYPIWSSGLKSFGIAERSLIETCFRFGLVRLLHQKVRQGWSCRRLRLLQLRALTIWSLLIFLLQRALVRPLLPPLLRLWAVGPAASLASESISVFAVISRLPFMDAW